MEFIFTILRIDGISHGHFDPVEESFQAFEDYNWLLNKAIKSKKKKIDIRVGLIIYCTLIELTPAHELLYNLLGCISGQGFIFRPFRKLYRKNKKGDLIAPPSAKNKFNMIRDLDDKISEHKL